MFTIRWLQCTRSLSEISFKTDPASTDYVVEAGATRNFMALKLAEEQAMREIEAEKEEERTHPMKVQHLFILFENIKKIFSIFFYFSLIVPLQIFAVLRLKIFPLNIQCLSLPLYWLQCLSLKNSNSFEWKALS